MLNVKTLIVEKVKLAFWSFSFADLVSQSGDLKKSRYVVVSTFTQYTINAQAPGVIVRYGFWLVAEEFDENTAGSPLVAAPQCGSGCPVEGRH